MHVRIAPCEHVRRSYCYMHVYKYGIHTSDMHDLHTLGMRTLRELKVKYYCKTSNLHDAHNVTSQRL